MPARSPLHRRLLATATGFLAAATVLVAATVGSPPAASAASDTTAWQNGAFSENTGGVVSRSDVFLGQPNTSDSQSLPLGNGSLGVAEWAAGGFTAQLNRSDTMPYRLSPGQVEIPGLAPMVSAPNFTGTLDLDNGVLDESGGGMTMQAWVPAGKDELVVNVTGASPAARETADLSLWSGRTPTAAASGAIGSLSQTWPDNSQTGSSGQTFGAMSAITAGGQNVAASVVSSTEVQVSFTPNSSGSFRVVIASPEWTGGNAITTASALIGGDTTATASSLLSAQSSLWNSYWANAGLIEASSSDGAAQYTENLRTLYLYDEAASMHSGDYPGSQAGVANMFAYDKDQQDWYPAGYWLWNLRGQVAANLSSGNFSLNLPTFGMYLSDLPAIESWTSAQMGGLRGACVPETMRFNGNGYYNGGSSSQNASCAQASSPSYNAENVTSGAELALWIWQQYEDTGSLSFLQQFYPLMEQAAEFLLADQSVGSDGYLHAVANAHETQWAVQDPTTDLAADQALFPAVVSAATLLNTDSSLVAQLKTAEGEIEPYPRTDAATRTQLLNPQPTSAAAAASADADAQGVTAGSSYLIEQPASPTTSLPFAQVTGTQATAARHQGNVQIGLDPAAVYPGLAASFNNVGITADGDTAPGNYDGNGASFSQTPLANAGAGPGATVTAQGLSYAFPSVAAGTSDNTVAEGQTITMSGSGTLGFLCSASYGPATGTGTITYTDGSTQSYTLTSPDWWSTTPPSGGTLAVSSAYQNRPGNTTYAASGNIFSETVALTAGKTVASITLPPGGALTPGPPTLHVFAIATSGGAEGPYGWNLYYMAFGNG
jgi:hypothetical protein